MNPTVFSVPVLIVGLALLGRSLSALIAFVLLSAIFGAASVVEIPALGGASVQPARFALLFVVCRLGFYALEKPRRLAGAIQQNAQFIAFCLLGAASAFIMPFLFRGTIDVMPIRPLDPDGVYRLTPLHFTGQNITAALYLLSSMCMALAASLAARWEKRTNLIVNVAVVIACLQVLFGALDGVFSQLGYPDWFNFVRNAGYAQHVQFAYSAKRLAGTFTEASAFAGFGYVWFIFLVELWLRNVKPVLTGGAAAALGLVVLASTSTTAYVSFFVYFLILLARVSFFPSRLPASKGLVLSGLILCAVTTLMLIILVNMDAWTEMTNILTAMTVNKMSSSSGVERLSLALQGFSAFVASFGLGIGPGSFRSSSLATAILGSVGVAGSVSFVGHVLKSLRLTRKSTYNLRQSGVEAVGSASAWAAVVGLVPALITSNSCDPGLLFAFFSGYAIGLRSKAAVRLQTKGRLHVPPLHPEALAPGFQPPS